MSPAIHKRLGHKKSRNGCLRCKTRRVKCDERRPCSHCVRHAVECSLGVSAAATSGSLAPGVEPQTPTTTASASPHTTESPQLVLGQIGRTGSSEQTPVPQGPQNGWTAPQSHGHSENHFSAEWIQSLRLMQHYCTDTCKSMSRNGTEELWGKIVPETAFAHEFLLNGLLAVAARHYGHCHPEQKAEYNVVSVHYQNLALEYFANRLNDINEDNCEAYFFLATFIFTLSVCSIAHPTGPEKTPTPSHVSQSFMLLQGVKGILDYKPINQWQQRGPLALLLTSYDEFDRLSPATTVFHRRLDKVAELARDLPRSIEVINAQSSCILALESLRTTHEVCLAACDKHAAIWSWPITLPLVFIELIGEGNPVALVILAHFAAFTRPFENRNWISQGWSKRVLEMLERELDREWAEWLVWPKKSVYDAIDVDNMELDYH